VESRLVELAVAPLAREVPKVVLMAETTATVP
jgi:hypothetical protein